MSLGSGSCILWSSKRRLKRVHNCNIHPEAPGLTQDSIHHPHWAGDLLSFDQSLLAYRALGFLFGGMVLADFLPDWALLIFPWPRKDVASGLALRKALPAEWPVPVIVSLICSVIFVGIALWRFKREEF